MKSYWKKISGTDGFSLAEIMITAAIAGGLALVIAQMMKNANVEQGRITAKSDADLMFNKINSILTNSTACNNTFAFVDTTGEITTMQSATAAAGLDVPTIIDKAGVIQLTANTTTGTKLGKARLAGLKAYSLSLTSDLANLEVTVNYQSDGKTITAKKRIIPLNADATSSDVVNCASAGAGDVGPWEYMSLPDLGIYYNGGSVSIGTNTSVNTGTATPAFAMGTTNTASASNASAFGLSSTAAGSQSVAMVGSFVYAKQGVGIGQGAVAGLVGSPDGAYVGDTSFVLNPGSNAVSPGTRSNNGYNAAALGSFALATGDMSVAIGSGGDQARSAEAAGESSIAIGRPALAYGLASIAIGSSNTGKTNSGVNSGGGTVAVGDWSIAIGSNAMTHGGTNGWEGSPRNNPGQHTGCAGTDPGNPSMPVVSTYSNPGQGINATISQCRNGESSIAIGNGVYGRHHRAMVVGNGSYWGGWLSSSAPFRYTSMFQWGHEFCGDVVSGGTDDSTFIGTNIYFCDPNKAVRFGGNGSVQIKTPWTVDTSAHALYVTGAAKITGTLTANTCANNQGATSVCLGNGAVTASSADSSVVMGDAAYTAASDSMVLGESSNAYGKRSFAFGTTLNAGDFSNANHASIGLGAMAIGHNSNATAAYSMTLGYNLTTSAQGAFAMGDSGGTGMTNSNADSFKARFDGGYAFFSDAAQTAAAALYFTNVGRLGIGDSSPSMKVALSTSGSNDGLMIKQTGNTAASLRLTNSGASGHDFGIFSTGTGNSQGAGKIDFYDYTNPKSLMTIDGNTANVGINNMTSPTQALDVNGNIKTNGCLYYASSSLGTCLSDARIKKEVRQFNLGLKELLSVNSFYFKYNGLAGYPVDGKEQIGVIAQDLEKNLPQLIVKKKIKLTNDDKHLTEIKAVNYSPFIYMAINAIKELYHKVMALFESDKKQNREIAAIKAENERLKSEHEEMKKMLCAKNIKASFCTKN